MCVPDHGDRTSHYHEHINQDLYTGQELTTVLKILVVHASHVVIGFEFSVHIQDTEDTHTCCLANRLASLDIVQHVCSPTYHCRDTLNLVIIPSQCQLDGVTVDPPGMLFDHLLVICQIPSTVEPVLMLKHQARG